MNTVAAKRPPGFDAVIARWPLAIGLAALIVPTLIVLARENWTTEAGIQGPIILATGLWLFFSQKDVIRTHRRAGSILIALPVGLMASLAYIAGQAFGFLVVQVAATILICEVNLLPLFRCRSVPPAMVRAPLPLFRRAAAGLVSG